MKTGPLERLLLIGCGILKREVRCLIEKNRWEVDTLFLDSSLHVNPDKLAHSLTAALAANRHRRVVVFYGCCCHWRMDGLLQQGNVCRTCGQNCVDMLLGPEVFQARLADGAFFLLEDWVTDFERNMCESLGTRNLDIIRDIFSGDRKYLLAVRTPGTRDFTVEAENAGRLVGVPVHWMDVSLDHLEGVLQATISKTLKEAL